MGVISIRLNRDEEKILKKLSDHFREDKSALIKKSLLELYENIMDLDEIKKFEAGERKGKASFFTAEEILKN
jgi:predicted transcriptional regulator